eukprot:365128-Chlamydomonas_euryale.AAC.5
MGCATAAPGPRDTPAAVVRLPRTSGGGAACSSCVDVCMTVCKHERWESEQAHAARAIQGPEVWPVVRAPPKDLSVACCTDKDP